MVCDFVFLVWFVVIRSVDESWSFGAYPTVADVAEICGVTPEFVSAIYAQHSRYNLTPEQVLDRGAAIRIARLIDEVE